MMRNLWRTGRGMTIDHAARAWTTTPNGAAMNEGLRAGRTRRSGRALPIGVLGLLIVAAIVALTSPGQAATTSSAPKTLNLVVEFDRHATVRDDVAPEGDSQGDQVIYEM